MKEASSEVLKYLKTFRTSKNSEMRKPSDSRSSESNGGQRREASPLQNGLFQQTGKTSFDFAAHMLEKISSSLTKRSSIARVADTPRHAHLAEQFHGHDKVLLHRRTSDVSTLDSTDRKKIQKLFFVYSGKIFVRCFFFLVQRETIYFGNLFFVSIVNDEGKRASKVFTTSEVEMASIFSSF